MLIPATLPPMAAILPEQNNLGHVGVPWIAAHNCFYNRLAKTFYESSTQTLVYYISRYPS